MKIHPVVGELFHADGRTDSHNEANSQFSLFCEGALAGILKNPTIKQRKSEVQLQIVYTVYLK
jgi:hypothetical protein